MIVHTHWMVYWAQLIVAFVGGYIGARFDVNDVKKALKVAYKENEFLRTELHTLLAQSTENPSAQKRTGRK